MSIIIVFQKRAAAALFEAELRKSVSSEADVEAAPTKRVRGKNWKKPELLVLMRNAVRYRDILTQKHPPEADSKKAVKSLQGRVLSVFCCILYHHKIGLYTIFTK